MLDKSSKIPMDHIFSDASSIGCWKRYRHLVPKSNHFMFRSLAMGTTVSKRQNSTSNGRLCTILHKKNSLIWDMRHAACPKCSSWFISWCLINALFKMIVWHYIRHNYEFLFYRSAASLDHRLWSASKVLIKASSMSLCWPITGQLTWKMKPHCRYIVSLWCEGS